MAGCSSTAPSMLSKCCADAGETRNRRCTLLSRMQATLVCIHTWVQPEEACGAAKVLPGEGRIFLEVINEHFIQSLGHVGPIQNIRICRKRGRRKQMLDWHSGASYSMCVCLCFCTSVVHVSGDLYVTLLRVHW